MSDFKLNCLASSPRIDLTKIPDDNVIHVNFGNIPPAPTLQDVSQLEKCIERSGDIDQLRSQLSIIQNEEKAEEEAKTARLGRGCQTMPSCIRCKSVAPFSWIITPCCKILICRERVDGSSVRWFTAVYNLPQVEGSFITARSILLWLWWTSKWSELDEAPLEDLWEILETLEEYLLELRELHHHHTSRISKGVKETVQEGQIVIFYDEGQPRGL